MTAVTCWAFPVTDDRAGAIMMRSLLWRGMLAGLIAAVVAATIALLLAEPQIDAAIAFEARHAMPGMADEELVSRAVQKTFGLYTAMTLYGAALGGLLSIVFAAAHGRVGRIGPRGLALLLAIAAFVAIVLVPALKYPPTPPAVGLHETVRLRTAAFFAMIGFSLLATTAAFGFWRRSAGRLGSVDRMLAAAAIYVVAIVLLQALLPVVDEVPADFPASLLWRFRIAAIGTQAVFWLVVGDLFGRMAEARLLDRARR